MTEVLSLLGLGFICSCVAVALVGISALVLIDGLAKEGRGDG